MSKRLVAVGEMLGGFIYENDLHFFLKQGKKEVELDSNVYNVWQTIKMTLNSREETVSLMQKSSPRFNVNKAIDELFEKHFLIEWNETYDASYFEQFSLVPKGKVKEIKDDSYWLIAFPKAEPVDLSMMAYFIWRHSHPFLSCNDTLATIHRITGISLEDIKREFIRWIPLLVLYDLVAITPKP